MKKKGKQDCLIVCLYVDDQLYWKKYSKMVADCKHHMMKEYELTDLGLMTLGTQHKQSKREVFISQGKYTENLLKIFHMILAI